MAWKKNVFLKNNLGQSMVEYMLLLAIVITVIVHVFKSDAFQRILGPDSEIFERLLKEFEYSYTNALPGTEIKIPDYSKGSQGIHDSYFDGTSTRFFGPKEAYGD